MLCSTFMSIKNIYGFITVRSSSSRLHNKCFLDFFGVTVLEHIILRCIFGGINPIICTTYNKKDDEIIKIAKKFKIKFFRGSENNKILRWFQCCVKFKINKFHTIDADDPFFDWTAIKKSFLELRNKYDIVLPSKVSRSGGASEGYSISKKFLEKIFSTHTFLKNENCDTEMIDPFIKKKRINFITLKGMSYELKKARLTLDYKEDYIFLKKVAKFNGSFNHRKNINFFLNKNLNLLNINYNKNLLWKKRQTEIIKRQIT